MEWKDISTAPKDGTPILAYGWESIAIIAWTEWGNDWEQVFANFEDSKLVGNIAESIWFEPTHWMPLPLPPNEQEWD